MDNPSYLFGKKVARLEIFTYRRLKLLYQDSAKVEAMTLFVQADLKISIPVWCHYESVDM